MTVFHKTPPPWFEAVKDLKPGGKRRIGDGLMASFNGRAYQRYDFREKTSEVYEPQMTLTERLEINRQMRTAESSAAKSSNLPPLMLNPMDWPVDGRVWLHKAGLSNLDIQDLDIGWSPDMQRVVIPLQMVDETQHWLARRTDNHPDYPKYLFPEGMRRGGGAFVPSSFAPYSHKLLVITEDFLSSYRVAKDAGYDSVSALGTSLDRDAVVRLAEQYDNIAVWLDPDYYGQQGARRIVKDFQQLGKTVTNIVSQRDPKNHEPGEIEIYVDDALKRL